MNHAPNSMTNLTLSKRLLPHCCIGLRDNPEATSVSGLRMVAKNEIAEYDKGENPLSDKQLAGLINFLHETRYLKDD